MTLAELLANATPGPWVLTEPEDSWHFKLASIICLGTSGSDDLDLAALAPDLARLALDMGEWIADQSCVGADRAAYCDIVCESCREPVALLARLDGIANKDKTT